MEMALQQGKDQLARLVAHFRSHRDYFHSPHYKEAHVRQELIDPFFIALGWDVRNERRVAPQYREVVTEESLDIEGHRKAPDYVFRVGQTPKFYAEAKKPGVAIKSDPAPAYQLRRYGWSAKLPLSVLTDFEELAVYDCRIRPRDTDKASAARIHYLGYDEYPDRWSELWELFSREAVWAGSFDRFAQAVKGKRGTGEVDTEFLKEIETWRDILARNIALRNPRLSIDELNDAVQRTIDRVIFLRMAEDRGMEPYEQLRQLAEGKDIYKSLVRELYHKADEKYNSGLFDFAKDTLTPRLAVDDRVLKPIIAGLYFPRSPYEFSVLPAEILGNVYEQFLGKVIRLTPGHQAKVEDKPEVKKAGGVYYTPAYIVEFIVKNTVGKMTEGKSPRQLEGFRVLDMACGSGSFLLRAYQCLLDHCLSWYVEHDPDKHPKAVWQHRGQWRLTTAERKRILIAHIFGVDIDRQAVEVTKLSLLLKVLEGENDQTLGEQCQLTLWEDRALPDLDQNVKCGNSLIGPDYFTDQLLPDADELRRINPFDWKSEFSDAMKAGGFDCVIGNPPYGAEFPAAGEAYLRNSFATFVLRAESYIIFIEKAVRTLKTGGILGFIVPDTFLNLGFTRSLREFLLRETFLREIVLLPSNVFRQASVDTSLLFVERAAHQEMFNESNVRVRAFGKRQTVASLDSPARQFSVATSMWHKEGLFNIQTDQTEMGVLLKVEAQHRQLTTFAQMYSGVKVYEVGKGTPPQTPKVRAEKPFTAETRIDASWSPLFDGKHVGRYSLVWRKNNWIKYGPWLAAPRSLDQFEGEKILIRKIVGETLIATHVSGRSYCNTLLFLLKLAPQASFSERYLLGLINSRFIGWYFRKKFQVSAEDTFPQIMIRDILLLPVPMPSPERHDRMVSLVEQMLELHKRLHAAEASASDRELYQRQIDATDREIDRLVYDLYGLTEDEIAIVEEGKP